GRLIDPADETKDDADEQRVESNIQDAASASCRHLRFSARRNECRRFFSRRRRAARSKRHPSFGLIENRRAQQQSTRAVSLDPTTGRFAKLSVSSDPTDISLERSSELIGAGCELRGIVEENEIKSPQRLRHGAIVNPLAHDRREALIQGCRVR